MKESACSLFLEGHDPRCAPSQSSLSQCDLFRKPIPEPSAPLPPVECAGTFDVVAIDLVGGGNSLSTTEMKTNKFS